MDLQINFLTKEKYKYLNRLWGNYNLGSPHIIGLQFTLIEGKAYATYEKWKQAYFESGKNRRSLLRRFSEQFYEMAVYPKKFEKKNLTWPIYRVNYFHGRTEEELNHIAGTLFNAVIKLGNPLDIIREEVLNYTEFKVLGEAWNYELFRFSRTVTILNRKLPKMKIKRARMSFVEKYGFQGLLTESGKPAAGVYVKSPGWLELGNLVYQLKEEEEKKLESYKKQFNTDVFVFYSRIDGKIINYREVNRVLSFEKSFSD